MDDTTCKLSDNELILGYRNGNYSNFEILLSRSIKLNPNPIAIAHTACIRPVPRPLTSAIGNETFIILFAKTNAFSKMANPTPIQIEYSISLFRHGCIEKA